MPDERQHNDSVDENMTVAPVRNGNGEITHFIAVKQDTCQGRSETRPLGRRKTRPDECVGDGDLQGGWRLERRPAVRFADCV